MATTTTGDPNQQKPLQPNPNDPLAAYAGRTLTSQEAASAAQAAGMKPNAGGDYFANVNNGQAAGSNYTWNNAGQGWSLQPTAPTNTTTAPATPPPTTAPPTTTPTTPPPITTADQTLTATTTPNAPPTGPTSIASSFQQQLVNMLNPQAVDANNPAVAPAIQANQLAGQRGLEQQRNALAEQSAANGTSNSGGFDSALSGLIANNANAQGQFAGSALQHLSDQNNANILAGLGIGSNLLDTGAARAQQNSQFGQTLGEQAREANQTNTTQNLGINTQGSLGSQDIALRGRLGDQQANLQLLAQLLQNSQFGASLDQGSFNTLFGGV